MATNELHLDILPPSQRRLWDELIDVPGVFTLYGGTAIALQIGHRDSADFDFFAFESFQPRDFSTTIPFLQSAEIIQQAKNTLTCLIERGGPVQISFFGVPNLSPIKDPIIAQDNGVKIASLLDLAGMKAAVVQQRPEAKDYIDLATMIEKEVTDLPTALAAAKLIYGLSFNPELTLKALSYYDDGNLKTIPVHHKERLLHAVRAVDLDRLPVLNRSRVQSHDQGFEQ
ncbi:MAG: nucleotidyl transferase AbiEii/AbiGii toxin family protein [Nitrospirales bacterium]|nr:nucleotidyl transferase AbiEii/AbiGii toxin family protein [Nitrospirales bacterium]